MHAARTRWQSGINFIRQSSAPQYPQALRLPPGIDPAALLSIKM
jgi:hypothetical protein